MAGFDGLAAGYERFRPGYPAETLARLAMRARAVEAVAPVAFDVGAGTGISTRVLRRALGPAWRVTGLEPGADMRATARRETPGHAAIDYRSGTGEALGAADGALGLALVAQALHWFDRPAFYREAGRALAPGGVLAVLYNDRDSSTPLLRDFEETMEREVDGYRRDYRDFDYVGELRALEWAAEVEVHETHWERSLSPDDFAGLMLSRANTRAFEERHGEVEARRRLTALAGAHAEGGTVALVYRTRLAMAIQRS